MAALRATSRALAGLLLGSPRLGGRALAPLGARYMAVDPTTMRRGALHTYFESLGEIVQPYIPRSHYAPLYTPTGVRQRWNHLMHTVQNSYQAGKIKQRVKGWTPLGFIATADDLYLRMNSAFARNDVKALEPIVTGRVLQSLKQTMIKRPGHAALQWIDGGAVEKSRVVCMRYIPLPDDKSFFAQVTVRVHRKQAVTHANATAEQKAAAKPQPVLEYVIYESCVSKSPQVWRICGKLDPPAQF